MKTQKPRPTPGLRKEDPADYQAKRRRAMAATPSSPVPSSNTLEGSGVTEVGIVGVVGVLDADVVLPTYRSS